MNLEQLRQLVTQGESDRLEFKKSTGELQAGMETLCALLNTAGGRVVFGVTDAGRIVGQQISDHTLQAVANAIRKLEPTAWIERTHRNAVAVQRLDSPFVSVVDTLDRFQLRREYQLLRAAVVLFGKQQIHGHAFEILAEASLFLKRHVPVAGWFEEGKWERQERPQDPFPALREAVVNAICHRDYSLPGGAVHVAMYDDRLEIISTGLLPPGITVADLKRDHASHLRNPLIAEPFYRRALIEKWGSGTQKIVGVCLSDGYPEPEFFEQAGAFYVRFPAGTYAPPMQIRHDLTDRQREILSILARSGRVPMREIQSRLSTTLSVRRLQEELLHLRKLGLVEAAGRGRAAGYWLREARSNE